MKPARARPLKPNAVAPFALPSYYRSAVYVQVLPRPASPPATNLEQLTASVSRLHHLRDGEVVLYRVARSSYWQARLHLFSGKWLRMSTRKRDLADAQRVACEHYDEIRFRERLGFSPVIKRFDEMAKVCVSEMRQALAAGAGKKIYTAYIAAIENYLVPFFGQRYLTSITGKDMAAFDVWRNERLGRRPKTSTLLTFACAFERVHQTAIDQGWISEKIPIPRLHVRGEKGEVRPAC